MKKYLILAVLSITGTVFCMNAPGESDARVNDWLIRYASMQSLEGVQAMHKRGANLNARNEYGDTALIAAARSGQDAYGRCDAVPFLIQAGADINAVDKNGNTALMVAASYGHFGICFHLLKAGANVHVKNKDRKTAWQLVDEDDHDIPGLLREFGARG